MSAAEEITPVQARRGLRLFKVAAVVLVVTMLFTAHHYGIFEQFKDPAGIRQTILDLGPWGYIAFLLAYTTLHPFGIPGTVFVVAASLIWPWPIAYGLSMAGTMAGTTVGFSFARFVARDWISKFIPKRFRRYNDALETRAFSTVITLRFIFWMPPLLHAFFGVSKVRFWTHFWGSFVGYLIPLFLMAFFGQRLFDAAKQAPLGVWIATPFVIAALAYGYWRIKRGRSQDATES